MPAPATITRIDAPGRGMTGGPVHDFCVIGGGIVGLSTALHLLERRPDIRPATIAA